MDLLNKKLLEEESKYSSIKTYKFGFLTWNLAGKTISDEVDFESVLMSKN